MTAAAEVIRTEAPEEVPDVDRSRAAIYGLLSALFADAPTSQLLDLLARAEDIVAPDADSRLAGTWSTLRDAAARACPTAMREEYDAAFIGTGRAPVSLHGLSYLDGTQKEKRLVMLRDDLADAGLARRADCGETEYHVSALCDVMRHLIAGETPAEVDAQQRFFDAHIAPWYARCFDAMQAAAPVNFYRHVAAFARAFLDVESQSLEIA